MSSIKTHQRVFALVMALLFLATALASGAAVIWQIRQDNKNAKQAVTQSQENSVQGKKLADFTPIQTVNELQKIDLVEGTGAEVKPGATVTAHYTGAVAATGVVFQSSHDGPNRPVSFSLNGVIQGWTDGVPGMKVGGKRRLIIPADQAYGATPPSGSGIPANAPLVFDVEITAVE